MRQRVMIAIALSAEPEILVADEPTTALDVTVQAQILEVLDRLRDSHGMAVLLITHDLGIVAGRADRVAVMYAGQIVEEAPTERLFARPSHPYTQGLFASVPRITGPVERLSPIGGSVPPPGAWPSGCRFRPRCPKAFDKSETMPPLLPVGTGAPDAVLAGGGETAVSLLQVRDLVKHYQRRRTLSGGRAAGAGGGRGVVRRRGGGDARPGRRVGLRQVLGGPHHPPAAGADRGTRGVRGQPISSRSTAPPSGRCGAGCRSSSRIPTARSIPG